MTAIIAAALLVIAQGLASQSSQGAGDTGEIRGRVVDKDTGRPLPEAQVMLVERSLHLNRTTTTDDAGVFRFTRLPAGQYDGLVVPGSHRGTHETQGLADGRSATIELARGAVRELAIALPRAGTIPVRVIDEFGDALAELNVVLYRSPAMEYAAFPMGQRTDDRGRIRIGGLPPGRYVACADPAGATTSQAVTKPVPDHLLRTCFPSAATEQEAEPIVVGSGQVDEIEIRMRRGRTFTIAGTVLDASGAPAAGAQIGLAVYAVNGSSSRGFSTGPDGRFRIANVSPGP